MSAPRSSLRVAFNLPSALLGVWHADALGASEQQVLSTGFAPLDAQLPGGGWPIGALSEVLQPAAGLHEWQLVLPALVQATGRRSGAVVVVAPPCEPFGRALQAQGFSAERLCLVRADSTKAALWAAEQALRCRDVLAVMAWLPQAQPTALRRLQLAAAQQQQLLWVFRPDSAALQASPALLRLIVQGAATRDVSASPGMQVQILKRRGPPLVQELDLPGCHPRLAQVLLAQAERRRAAQEVASAVVASRNASSSPAPVGLSSVRVAGAGGPEGRGHALDRAAIALVR